MITVLEHMERKSQKPSWNFEIFSLFCFKIKITRCLETIYNWSYKK